MEKLKSQAKMLSTRRFICYAVLVLLAILSLFPFYIMVVNATRSHPQIQSGFSAIPGTQLWLHIKQFIKSERWFDVVAGQQVNARFTEQAILFFAVLVTVSLLLFLQLRLQLTLAQ